MKITLYKLAERYVGTTEIAGLEDNPLVLAMLKLDDEWPDSDEVPWCSAAMNWWAWHLRLPRSKSLRARSWLDVGRPVPLKDLEVGWDVVVLWRGEREGHSGHVGLYAGWQNFHSILLLGGNQSNRVCVAPYSADRILGCRRLYE